MYIFILAFISRENSRRRRKRHDLDEDKKECENCGETLRCIGEELAYVEMAYHPGYYEKINHF